MADSLAGGTVFVMVGGEHACLKGRTFKKLLIKCVLDVESCSVHTIIFYSTALLLVLHCYGTERDYRKRGLPKHVPSTSASTCEDH